jgi:hypothetical protein
MDEEELRSLIVLLLDESSSLPFFATTGLASPPA